MPSVSLPSKVRRQLISQTALRALLPQFRPSFPLSTGGMIPTGLKCDKKLVQCVVDMSEFLSVARTRVEGLSVVS